MNWKTTLILFVVVASLGAWVYFGESKLDPTESGAHQDLRVLRNFKFEDVKSVAIARGKGLAEEIVASKAGNDWRLEKPLQDKADDGKLRELLAPLEFLDAVQKVEGDKVRDVPFGDVAVRLSIVRPSEKGGDVTVEIGQELAGDLRYLRISGR